MDKRYLAGFFDGEGHVSITPDTNRGHISVYPSLTVSNACKEPIEEIYKKYGGNMRERNREEKNKTMFIWKTGSRTVTLSFLKDVLPYLIVKREISKLVVDILEDIYKGKLATKEEAISVLKKVREARKLMPRGKPQRATKFIKKMKEGEIKPAVRFNILPKERKIIRKYAGKLNSREIAEKIDRTPAAIRSFMRREEIEGFNRGEYNKTKRMNKLQKVARERFGKKLYGEELIEFMREKLKELYWDKKMSGAEVAEHLGIPGSTIYHWLDFLGIETRSYSEATELRYKND